MLADYRKIVFGSKRGQHAAKSHAGQVVRHVGISRRFDDDAVAVARSPVDEGGNPDQAQRLAEAHPPKINNHPGPDLTGPEERGEARWCAAATYDQIVHRLSLPSAALAHQKLSESVRSCYAATDRQRLDGHPDKVCCSLQYPNGYYFDIARRGETARNFPDWVCLLIDKAAAAEQGTLFCPRNAAAGGARPGADALAACYAAAVVGQGGQTRRRGAAHDPASPTDVQAEVLLPAPVPLSLVRAIVFPSDAAAREEHGRLDRLGRLGAAPPFAVAPALFDQVGRRRRRHPRRRHRRPAVGPVTTVKDQSRVTGMLLGAAVGDALGWPQEARGGLIGGQKARDGREPAAEFRAWTRTAGRYSSRYRDPVRAGEYSDDTQLLCATARACLARADWLERLTLAELPAWPVYQRGGGGAVLSAAGAWAEGRAPWDAGRTQKGRAARERYMSAGANGAAMRIAPHAVVASNPRELADRVLRDGLTTHGHPRALVGAVLYAAALDRALRLQGTVGYGDLIDAARDGLLPGDRAVAALPEGWGDDRDRAGFASAWEATLAVRPNIYLPPWATASGAAR